MRKKKYTIRRKQGPKQIDKDRSAADLVRELKRETAPVSDYRERSLRLHGLICAKCAREFDETNLNLLTVHHKDGNHDYNPPDGSNWENLCVYCHDDEHNRGRLGDYLSDNE